MAPLLFVVYDLVCPTSERIMYIGEGGQGRAYTTKRADNPGLMGWMTQMFFDGKYIEDLVRIHQRLPTKEEAVELQNKRIVDLRPPLNRMIPIKSANGAPHTAHITEEQRYWGEHYTKIKGLRGDLNATRAAIDKAAAYIKRLEASQRGASRTLHRIEVEGRAAFDAYHKTKEEVRQFRDKLTAEIGSY